MITAGVALETMGAVLAEWFPNGVHTVMMGAGKGSSFVGVRGMPQNIIYVLGTVRFEARAFDTQCTSNNV